MQERRSAAELCALAFAAFVSTSGPLSAQAVSGTILGVVKDTTGAVVPEATVLLSNPGTGFVRTVVTDAKGEYTAPSLPTGTYSVSAERTGFARVTRSGVHVGVDQKARIDLELGVGDRSETLEIRSESPLLQTSSSDLSATVESREIETLPLNGRNFVSLTRTLPGVLRGIPGNNIDGAGGLGWRASASFSASGQKPRDNNFLLDGVDNNETWIQSVVIFPSASALDEFKLQTSTYAAEFGRSMGGVVNLQIKSGANPLRGSAFGFLRDDALDANNFFNNKVGKSRPDFRQRQFGATLGGPIVKNKAFFFADYQGQRVTAGQTFLSTVPTEKMRRGDFSEITRQIYDPLTGQPFPGNVIPLERWDTASRNIMDALIPRANIAGEVSLVNGQTVGNYLNNPSLLRQDDQFDLKVDQTLGTANRFFVRYSFERSHRFLPPALPQGDGSGVAGDSTIRAHSLAFNDTHTFGPRWLNELRLGYNSFALDGLPIGYGEYVADKMGIPGINFNDYTSSMSTIGFAQLGMRNLGSGQPFHANLDNLQILDNLTHIRGRHTFKAGMSATFRSREMLVADSITGTFGFNQNLTSNCGGVRTTCRLDPTTGFDVASFVLGYASIESRALIGQRPYTETRPEWAVYVQDDIRATSKLTLNLGLRWDVFVPWVEADNRQSNFDPSTGRFVVAADDAMIDGVPVGRYLQTYSKTDFGPRFGFAYDTTGNGRTIVRGGFGMFWNWGVGGTSSSKAQNPPFLRSQAFSTTFGTTLKLSNGLPPLPEVDPSLPPSGSTRSAFEVGARDSYALNWNLNLQHQIGKQYLVELAYVGSSGGQLVLKTDQNRAPPTVGVTNPNVNRPYFKVSPALQTVGTVLTAGTLDYHALLVKFQRRFANGFSFLNAYAFGKAIDLASDNDGLVNLTNVLDLGYNHGPADYDVTHTLSSSWIYELPVGRTSRLGGWQVNGIAYWRTGLPVFLTQATTMASTGGVNRPNRIGHVGAADPTIDQWFDPSAFQQTPDPTGTFGNAGRGILRGPGQWNVDLSLIKVTRFGRYELDLRVEAFNVFNHPQFAQPNGQFGSASFGKITDMLSNPACAGCGTTERQIQLGAKLSF